MKQIEIQKQQKDRLKEHMIRELEIDKNLIIARHKMKLKEIDNKIKELKR